MPKKSEGTQITCDFWLVSGLWGCVVVGLWGCGVVWSAGRANNQAFCSAPCIANIRPTMIVLLSAWNSHE